MIGPAAQNALYRQAGPERVASAAGLLRTSSYLGAPGASAATAAFSPHRARTAGLHGLAMFKLAGSALPPATTLPDRSLGRLASATPKPLERPDRLMSLTTLDPRTALVAIDLQNGIVGMPVQPHAASDVVSRTAELADAFRSRNLPVVLVRVSFAPDWADAVPGRTEHQARGLAFPDGWDTLVDELTGHPGDIRVTKHNWSAFHGTDLDVQLRRRGITQIVLTGIATSIGVESTARDAYAHGYHVTLATDAMADAVPEAHANSVERIFPRLGESGTTAEILELLAKTHN